MRNGFGRNNGSGTTRFQKVGTTNPSSEETCGVEVACTGRVEKFRRHCRDVNALAVGRNDDGPSVATGETGDCTMPRYPTSGLIEVIDLVERANFILVRKKDVDVMFNDLKEFGTMAIDAEAVGKRERHASTCTCRPTHHIAECTLGRGFIPQIPLEINNASGGNERKIDVVCRELSRYTK